VAEFEKSPKMRRRAGLERLTGLLEQLRSIDELNEGRPPGNFRHGSRAFLHFHYHPDGKIVADVRLSDGIFHPFDVSDEGGQYEVLSVVEDHLGR
jgi:hypothetical protein